MIRITSGAKRLAAALVPLLLAGTALHAEDGAAVAARFGGLEAVRQMALSPSGGQVAYIAGGPGGAQILYVVNIAGGGVPKGILKQVTVGETLRHCSWATEETLVCNVDFHSRRVGSIHSGNRIFAMSNDGKSVRMLSDEGSATSAAESNYGGSLVGWGVEPGHVLMTTWVVHQEVGGGSVIASNNVDGLAVQDVNVVTRNRVTAERPREDAIEYIADGHGKVRIMGSAGVDPDGNARGITHYVYRKPDSRDWFTLSDVKITNDGLRQGFDPWAVDPAKNVAYGFDDNGGRRALFAVHLDGSGQRDLVLARPDVDIDAPIRIGRNQRVVGASYATERRVAEYFDPDLRKLGAGLEKALPGHPAIDFVDSSADESKLLIFAGSDLDPGSYYLYDKATHQLGGLLPVRPGLAGVALAPMKSVTYAAADGTQIPAYLTLPPGSNGKGLPAIVMPHGGPGARDEWGFDWLVQFFAARGFAVIQPNFRGSTGYGTQWYQKNGFKSWRTAIGDVNDAARWLTAQGIAQPGKLVVFGWAYGGYAALQSQVLDPDLYKAVVAVAPVTDLAMQRTEESVNGNGAVGDRYFGSGPHITEGSPALNAERFKVPVLMFHGDNDQNVNIEQSRHMANRLRAAGKTVELVEYPGMTHSLVGSEARSDMLRRADAFFRQALGMQ